MIVPEIGLARLGAQTGELRTNDFHGVITVAVEIWEGFKLIERMGLQS